MKRIVSTSLLLMLVFFGALGQTPSDTIEIKKRLGTVFLQNGKALTPKKLLEATKSNPEAYELMKKAKNKMTVSSVIGGVGGFLIGWQLGTAIGGGKPNWAMVGVGAGVLAVGIPISAASTREAKRAIQVYNDDLRKGGLTQVDLKVGLMGTGLGAKLTF